MIVTVDQTNESVQSDFSQRELAADKATTPKQRSTPQQFAFIHALRGVAAMLVVWAHLSGFWLYATGNVTALQDVWREFIASPLRLYQNGGHLGVVLFFLISGFIITHTSLREDRRAFAIKRFMRIFPPLAAAIVIVALLLAVAAQTGTTLFGTNDGVGIHWIASFFLVDGFLPGGRVLDVTWTLVIELVFYLLTFALLSLSRSRPFLATALMSVAWIAITVLALAIPSLFPFGGNDLPIYVGILVLGRFVYLGHMRIIGLVPAILFGTAIAVVFLIAMELREPGFLLAPGGWPGYEPLVSYGYALVIFLLLMRLAPKRTVQPFRLLGDVSYSLYLLHIPVGITVLNLLDRAAVPQSMATIIAILASIGVAWLSWRYVELPAQRLAREWASRKERKMVDPPGLEPGTH